MYSFRRPYCQLPKPPNSSLALSVQNATPSMCLVATCTCTYVFTRMYSYMYVRVYTYIYTYIHVKIYMFVYRYTCIRKYTYICVHTYICTYIYMYMYTHIHVQDIHIFIFSPAPWNLHDTCTCELFWACANGFGAQTYRVFRPIYSGWPARRFLIAWRDCIFPGKLVH